MIDAHCHLNFNKFEHDYDQIIKTAKAAGVKQIINVGTQISSSKLAVELADKYEGLYAIVGVHPHHADKTSSNWLSELKKLTQHPKVIAIGECGLDYYNYKSNGIVDPDVQKEIFLKQLELSHKAKLPLQLHSRDEMARAEALEMLISHKNLLQSPPGMFHCMAGSKESLKSALELGFYIGFDGNITYSGIPPGEPVDLKELVKYTPLDRIIIETDSPYLTPVPHRGERNEPKYAIIIAEVIATIKGVSFEEVAEQTDKNVAAIFKKFSL
jgi:TatD DNase family protein